MPDEEPDIFTARLVLFHGRFGLGDSSGLLEELSCLPGQGERFSEGSSRSSFAHSARGLFPLFRGRGSPSHFLIPRFSYRVFAP
jgi:hypothetical protein